MGELVGGTVLVVLLVFSIIIFIKVITFILNAEDLYKKMIQKEEEIIKLLIEICDNTKKLTETQLQKKQSEIINKTITEENKSNTQQIVNNEVKDKEIPTKREQKFCYYCGKELSENTAICPKCGAPLS
jgi:ABC-type bacteriocin/lantibiotic exporter with double-glycine peptidase domain